MLIVTLQAALSLPPAPRADVDFLQDVYPVFQAHCIECHGPTKQKGKLRLDRREGLFGAQPGQGVVVPGDLAASLLIELVSLPAGDPEIMPAEGDPLSADQIDLLRRWVAEGAAFAEPAATGEAPADELVLAPLSPEAAARRDAALATLAERGVQAVPVAQDTEALDVNLSLLREKAGDEEARALEGLAGVLVWLNASGTALGDAGLASLGRCGELRRLNLSRTAVSDAGLAALAGLEHLEYLNLYGTAIGDAGLAHLVGLKRLRKLYLWQTAVSDEGVARLTAALPELAVNRGEALLPPPSTATPINATCLISGKALDPAFTSELDGKLVGFCCGDCKAKFDADPEAFRAKLDELAGAKPINERCPVSDQPIDPAQTSKVGDKVVGFCCGDCKAKFDADPKPFLAKLGL